MPLSKLLNWFLPLPATMYEAIVILLLKPGKDPLLPDSYRPISLLPTDVKILAKVFATRLSKVLSSLIHTDQSGFIPEQSTATNIRRLYLNLQLPVDNPGIGLYALLMPLRRLIVLSGISYG